MTLAMLGFVDQCLITRLLEIFTEFIYNMNGKKIIEQGNKILVATNLVGQSERGNRQNFILALF